MNIDRWFKPNGSTVVHEVLNQYENLVVVASLKSNAGWQTYKGSSIKVIGGREGQGELLDALPPGATEIHTGRVAGILQLMKVLPESEAIKVLPRLQAYVRKHKTQIEHLDKKDPALIAMRSLMHSCAWVGHSSISITRRDVENCTRLEAHVQYLRSLLN